MLDQLSFLTVCGFALIALLYGIGVFALVLGFALERESGYVVSSAGIYVHGITIIAIALAFTWVCIFPQHFPAFPVMIGIIGVVDVWLQRRIKRSAAVNHRNTRKRHQRRKAKRHQAKRGEPLPN